MEGGDLRVTGVVGLREGESLVFFHFSFLGKELFRAGRTLPVV